MECRLGRGPPPSAGEAPVGFQLSTFQYQLSRFAIELKSELTEGIPKKCLRWAE